MHPNISPLSINVAHPRGAHAPARNATRALRRTLAVGIGLLSLLCGGRAQAITTHIVINNADSGPGSLRQAIFDAASGEAIGFDMTKVVSPILLTSGEL